MYTDTMTLSITVFTAALLNNKFFKTATNSPMKLIIQQIMSIT